MRKSLSFSPMEFSGLITILILAFWQLQAQSFGINGWIITALLVPFSGLTLLGDYRQNEINSSAQYIRLIAMTVIITVIFLIGEDVFAVIVLFFIVSVTAMQALQDNRGLVWIVAFALLTALFVWWISGDFVLSLINGVSTFGGYLFIGNAAVAQVRAERAQAESERLNVELQAANEQLRLQAHQAEELAAAEERNRLARDVHDTLGHRLTVAAVQLEGAQRLVDKNPVKAKAMIGTVREQVVEGLAELRNTISRLRAPIEADLSLPAALQKLVDEFSAATGLDITLSVPKMMLDISPDVQQTLYRIAQEALTNIQKHAQASTVKLAVQQLATDQLQLTIKDNGVGLPQDRSSGYGLQGMQERAAQHNGTVTFTANQPTGTVVTAIVNNK